MARFGPRTLGQWALVMAAVLFIAACGTTTTPAPTPTPTPVPTPTPTPGPTTPVQGKVFLFSLQVYLTCILSPQGCSGAPVPDRTELRIYDDAVIPFSARAQREIGGLQQVVNHPGVRGKRPDKAIAKAAAALKALSSARPAKVPGGAMPLATTATSNGQYTFSVPNTFIGKQLLICVTGWNTTGTPNPANPNIIGPCTTMLLMANTGGGAAINVVNFGTILLGDNEAFVIGTNLPGPLGQKDEIAITFTGTSVPAGVKTCLDSTLGAVPDPIHAGWSAYRGTAARVAGDELQPIRTVSRTAANVYYNRGIVQWRSEAIVQALYDIAHNCNLYLLTGLIVIGQVTADAGQWVFPQLLDFDPPDMLIVRDEIPLRFGFANRGLGAPATGSDNYHRNGAAIGSQSFITAFFNEPGRDTSTDIDLALCNETAQAEGMGFIFNSDSNVARAFSVAAQWHGNWSLFTPAGDTTNWTHAGSGATYAGDPTSGAGVNTVGAGVEVWDANFQRWAHGGTGECTLKHRAPGTVSTYLDTILAVRLTRFEWGGTAFTNVPNPVDPVLGQTIKLQFSTGPGSVQTAAPQLAAANADMKELAGHTTTWDLLFVFGTFQP